MSHEERSHRGETDLIKNIQNAAHAGTNTGRNEHRGSGVGKTICFILPNFHAEFSGGAETQCFFLAVELITRGWHVHYIRESDSDAVVEHNGIIVHAIPKRKKLFKWKNWLYLRRVMETVRADFWYVRANISYLPQVKWHARKTLGRTIWAFSSDSQFYYTRRNIKKRYAHNAFAMIEHFLFFMSLKYVDRIIVQTEDQGRFLERRRLSGEVIYNAHPIPDAGSEAREDIVVWIGRLHRNKHPERFLSIARHLRNSSIELFLVGDTDNKAISNDVERRLEDLPNLHWMGRLSPIDVHALLNSARVLVNTSDMEGFSNTFIEAWMRGVPVVTLHVDPDNFISERKLGFVAGDTTIAARKIEELIGDRQMWLRISANCVAFSREKFGITGAVDRLEEFLLNPGAGKPVNVADFQR
jgi:glycosyltransferase involved in cell wall biosynthesis